MATKKIIWSPDGNIERILIIYTLMLRNIPFHITDFPICLPPLVGYLQNEVQLA